MPDFLTLNRDGRREFAVREAARILSRLSGVRFAVHLAGPDGRWTRAAPEGFQAVAHLPDTPAWTADPDLDALRARMAADLTVWWAEHWREYPQAVYLSWLPF